MCCRSLSHTDRGKGKTLTTFFSGIKNIWRRETRETKTGGCPASKAVVLRNRHTNTICPWSFFWAVAEGHPNSREINTPWCKTLETKQQKPFFISNNQPSTLIYLKLLSCIVRDRTDQEVWLNKIWREKMYQNPTKQKTDNLYITCYCEDKYIITIKETTV